jgi:hypothetical protein
MNILRIILFINEGLGLKFNNSLRLEFLGLHFRIMSECPSINTKTNRSLYSAEDFSYFLIEFKRNNELV